ncbi:hypothetical protein L6164_006079 [Bauhinia variegata]|uniref:Uncharacterized protein n=1 Tax=Bauhinia variegata TaxID=167791 RepID=A0ACB9PT72_BAUVA|nr:hypothetical protein L6164_006079 [Bauhinia variegata]
MFKSWSKKNKIKCVFKMQFQATQVPKMKKSALMISLVPDDVGKPTVKLEKAPIQDGTCLWENPIFESVKLIRDAKSGNLYEKIYHLVVSTGSSKSGFLGEASIDFAGFAAETEPVTISLPLKFANSGVILHVTIQNVEGYTDQRNGEYHGAMGLCNEGGLKHRMSFGSTGESSYNIDEDGKPTKRYGYAEQNAATVEESNGTSPIADSWEEFKTENGATDGKKTSQDAYSFLAHFKKNPQTNGTADAISTGAHAGKRSHTDWSVGSESDGSLGEWTNSLQDNLPRERPQESTDNATEMLKSEIASLKRQLEVSELELQSLRRQIVKESSWGQNMSKQIIILREERDAIKTKYEELKSQKNFNNETETSRVLQSEIKDARLQLEATKEELDYEKELSSNLKLQLQKTQTSNSQLILAVRELEALPEHKNKELLYLSTNKNFKVGREPDESDATEVDTLKQKIADLKDEIAINNKPNEELNEHIEELSLEYELLKKENLDVSLRLKQGEAQQIMLQNEHSASLATIQQLESQVDILEEKIKNQADEFSGSLDCINELENQVKSLEKELKIQAENFEDDIYAMNCAKTEQEERAIQAEEALRKTRHNNAITSERFQEEYRMLSVEMASKVEESEKVTLKAIAEADELQQKNKLMEEMLQKCNRELRLVNDQNELKMKELWNQIDLKEKTIEHMSQELEKKSKELEDAQRHTEEKDDALFRQLQMLKSEIRKLMTEHVTEMMMQKNNKRGDLDEKEMTLAGLLSEVETFKIQHNELKHSLHKEQIEKENMKKKISHLQGEMKKKEAELAILEKKLKNNRGQAAVTHAKVTSRDNELAAPPSSTKANVKLKMESVTTKGTNATSTAVSKSERGRVTESDENKISLAPHRSGVETSSANELATLDYNDDCECNAKDLFTEVAMLKERNKSMENELKDMQERYSEISLKFAEVESERQQLVMTVRNLKNGKKN